MSRTHINPETLTYPCADKVIAEFTKLRPAERDALERWLCREGEPIRLEVLRRQSTMVQRFTSEGRAGDSAKAALWKQYQFEVLFSLRILAIYSLRYEEQRMRKKSEKSKEEVAAAAEIRTLRIARLKAQKKRRAAPRTAQFRDHHYQLVAELRRQGLSWRECSQYLLQYHHVTYAYPWLQRATAQIESEIAAAGIADD
ncbi:MAG: hypothetical protein ED859_15245 [Desulfuromonadales bacterium]|nr:MAG: hypothetical protein ED859_15245 [Desulfuromonadales bacterium]